LKILSQQTLLGQKGINLIERRIHEMGYWWYPSAVAEVGIDGILEIRDGRTGQMTNFIIQVQSKATERPWSREQLDTFDYVCEEEDLQYWLAGNAPVILVMSKPSKDEAYWISVKQYFESHPENRSARRISVIKSACRFDKSAAQALLHLAAPREAGAYLSPRPKTERLFTNLLGISHYAEELHIAQTDIRDPAELWTRARQLGVNVGSEWLLSDGNLVSFHDLSETPWNRFCETGTHEIFATSEWAESDDPTRQRHFVALLNRSLTERLKEWGIRRRPSDDIYYFLASKAFRARRIDFSGSGAEQFRTVVKQYRSGKTSYVRHMAFGGYFKQFDNAWYLEITPSYVFTIDGFRPSKYEGDLLQGIKLLEHNDSILVQVHLWADILTRKADLVHSDYQILNFSELLTFDLPYGINDKEWLSREELDIGVSGLDSLAKMPLFVI
jgi:Domain of unknown function (DUF4365)